MRELVFLGAFLLMLAVGFQSCKKENPDVTPPVITLEGSAEMMIPNGFIYNEPGFTAIDDVDGDITANVVVTNNINKDVDGHYTVNYSVKDAAGNEGTKQRKVQVLTVK